MAIDYDIKIREKIKDLQDLAERETKEFTDYFKGQDDISIVLKSHLYIESIINNIFKLVFPSDSKIADLTFSKKIDVLESLDLSVNKRLVIILRGLNKLRNNFAHNYKYELKEEDIARMGHILPHRKIKKNLRLKYRLNSLIYYAIGHLHFIRAFEDIYPFFSACLRNDSIFKRDKFYDKKKIFDNVPDDFLNDFYIS